MTLTDVPQSGKYFQQGATVQIVIQLLDVETGLPVQLQAATNLSISLLYPDLVTARTFVASLYTNGTDGMISYLTGYSDLSEVGLYQVQGGAKIGGISIPPSYRTDFYVLPNVGSGTEPGIVLKDSAGGFWQVTILPAGNLKTSPVSSPSSFEEALYLTDQNGKVWTITVLPTGNLDTN